MLTLYDILDHETGDSWNGTHGHTISVRFIVAENRFCVCSSNDCCAEFKEADFTAAEIREQLFVAAHAKYFDAFCDIMNRDHPGIVPELTPDWSKSGIDFKNGAPGMESAYHAALKNVRNSKWNDGEFDAGVVNHQSPGNRGWTLLHEAALGDEKYDVVQQLLKAGARPDARDCFDATPLHVAAAFGNFMTAHFLIEAGADINARNYCGQTPFEIASLAEASAPKDDNGAHTMALFLSNQIKIQAVKATEQNLARLDRLLSRRRPPGSGPSN